MKNNGNKKRLRRLMSGLMASVMCLGMLPGAAFAEEEGWTSNQAGKVEMENGNYVIDDVHYYRADDIMMTQHTDKIQMYGDLLGGYYLNNNGKSTCIADEWLSLAVNIGQIYGWGRIKDGKADQNAPPMDPIENIIGKNDVHPAMRSGGLGKESGMSVYSTKLCYANSMKQAEQKMRDHMYASYTAAGGGDDDYKEILPAIGDLKNDETTQPVYYLMVSDAKSDNGDHRGHGGGIGVVFYDFSIQPILPSQESSRDYHRESKPISFVQDPGNHFVTGATNPTTNKANISQALEGSVTAEVNSSTSFGKEVTLEQSIEVGTEWSTKIGPVELGQNYTVGMSTAEAIQNCWTKGTSQSKTQSVTSELAVSMDPYTAVELIGETGHQTVTETWTSPMALNYKVKMVYYGVDMVNKKRGNCDANMFAAYPAANVANDQDHTARESLAYRYDRKSLDGIDWNWVWNWANNKSRHTNTVNLLRNYVPAATHPGKIDSVYDVTRQTVAKNVAMYPMKEIVCTDAAKSYTLSKGDYVLTNEIHLGGRLARTYSSAPYFGFNQEFGHWVLETAAGEPVPEDSRIARLVTDPDTGVEKVVAGDQTGKVYLKYIIDEDYYAETGYLNDNLPGAEPITNANIKTVRIPITVEETSKEGWKIQLSGSQTIAAGDPAVAPDLTVKVYNEFNRQVNVPVHWYAKDLNTVEVDHDTFAAPVDLKPGKYTVVAYLGSNPDAPDTYTEHEIEVKAPRTLGSIVIPEEVALAPKEQTLNMNTLSTQMYDQYKGTDLDKAVNPKAALDSSEYFMDADFIWTAESKDVTVKNGVAQFPARNGSYTLTASCNGAKSNPVTVKVSGFLEDFPDVKPGAWFYNGVMYSAERGFISGLPDGTFGPSVTMTRAQLVQMLYAFEGKPEVAVTDKFSDVKAGDWYAKAVSWGVQKGITSGVGDGTTFAPNNKITRQEMAVMLHAFKGRVSAETQLKFVDNAQIASWAAPAVQWVVTNGLMGSTSTNPAEKKFSPMATATRAEAATIMMNLDLMGK